MKVLLLNSLYEPNVLGGAERVVRGLAEGLLQAGDEPVVLSLDPEGERTRGEVGGVRVHYIPLKNLYWPFTREPQFPGAKPLWHAVDAHNPVMAREAARVLEEERPDLVHTHNLAGFSTAVWQAVKRRRVPLVHTLHDYYLLCPKTSMFRNDQNCAGQCWDCRLYTRPRRALSSHPDAVVSISRFVLDRHLQHGYFGEVPRREVIPNAYARRADLPAAAEASSSGQPLRIGYIGQITPIKGVELLLQAVRELPPEGWELHIAGKGAAEYQEQLRATYASPNIHFLGFARGEEFYREVDVLVVPSLWHEPFGMVVIEAFAHGVPVVASRRGGIPEIIEDRRTGVLFEPGDPQSLPGVLRSLLQDPARVRQMRENCRRRARDFSPESIIQAYRGVYTAVTREPRKR